MSTSGTRRVRLGVGERPDTVVLDLSGRHAAWVTHPLTSQRLWRYSSSWHRFPELCEALPSLRDRTWRRYGDMVEMHLRVHPSARWHDGTRVTAADVRRSHALLLDLGDDLPHAPIVAAVDSIEVDPDDDLRFVMRWDATQTWKLFEDWGTVLPVAPASAGPPDRASLVERLHAHPMSHGPFRARPWSPGEPLVTDRVDPGHDRPDGVDVHFCESPHELARMVERRQVDMTELSGLGVAEAGELADHVGYELDVTSSATWEHLDLNVRAAPLNDVEFRRGLAHALDRLALARAAFGDGVTVADSWLPARHPAFDDTVPRYAHSAAKALEAFARSGHHRREDGLLRDPSGRPVTLELLTTRADGSRWTATKRREQVADLVAAQLRKVGITVRVDARPAAEAYRTIRSRGFAHLALFAWSIALEANGYLMWHSSQIPTDASDYGINVSGWSDPLNDRILTDICDTPDDADRNALLRQQQHHWAHEVPAIPLGFAPWVNVRRPDLAGLSYVGAFGSYVTWNCADWRWTDGDDRARHAV